MGVSRRECAKIIGVTEAAIRKAITAGRVSAEAETGRCLMARCWRCTDRLFVGSRATLMLPRRAFSSAAIYPGNFRFSAGRSAFRRSLLSEAAMRQDKIEAVNTQARPAPRGAQSSAARPHYG